MEWRALRAYRNPEARFPVWIGGCGSVSRMEAIMRPVGMVLLTGAAAIVAWKIVAALFFGLIGMALKVGLVILVGYFILKMINGKKDE